MIKAETPEQVSICSLHIRFSAKTDIRQGSPNKLQTKSSSEATLLFRDKKKKLD